MAKRSHGTTHLELIANLKENGVIKTDKVEMAMKAVDRGDFCTTSPYQDSPQRLVGFSVTISALHMHAHALEILSSTLKEGAAALDVGSGSGYLTACMAFMVGKTGRSVGIDRIADLKKVAEENVGKRHQTLLDSARVRFIHGDGTNGYKRTGPYDAIHVGAAATEVPAALLDQLKPGGRMFIPVGPDGGDQEMQQIDKLPNGGILKRSLFGVRYGPLIKSIQESGKPSNKLAAPTVVKISKTEKKVEEDDVPEQLKCPICFEVPLAEIYQCKNGHTICSKCEANVKECPQCRIPIPVNGELIRNRALESLLDNFPVTCPNQPKGCREKILKKNVKNHLSNCIHSGKSIQLCRKLFPKDSCNFWTNALTSFTSLNHFVSTHNGVLVKGTSVSIIIGNFKDVANHLPSDGLWEPVLLTSKGREHFMILTFFNKTDKSIAWTCLNLDSYDENEEQYEIEYFIESLSKKVPQLKWKCPPLSVINCEELVSNPVFRIPISTLEKYYMEPGGSDLKLLVNIKSSSGGQATEQGKSVTIYKVSLK